MSEGISWVLMAGSLYCIVIGVTNAAKRQPYALLMALCGLLMAVSAAVVAELVSK